MPLRSSFRSLDSVGSSLLEFLEHTRAAYIQRYLMNWTNSEDKVIYSATYARAERYFSSYSFGPSADHDSRDRSDSACFVFWRLHVCPIPVAVLHVCRTGHLVAVVLGDDTALEGIATVTTESLVN